MSPAAASDLAASLTRSTGVKFTAGDPAGAPFGADRAVTMKIVSPGNVYQGRVTNPDPTLRAHSWDGICLYDRMERQFPTYAGVCNLWADKVCANDLAIKPGDPDSGRSREMAEQTRRLYRKLADKHIINRKAVKGRFFGFAPTGKAGWRVDEETQLLSPTDLYDIPQKYIDFREDGTALVKTDRNPNGTQIPDDSVMFYRWGSRFTPWGEADAQFCYLPLWYVQQCRQFGMQGLEILGRPIPWVEIPDTMDDAEFDNVEARLKAQYKYYVITRTSANRQTVTFPSMNVLANGNAGRSEMEYMRYFYGEVYIYILGVQMTQDKTGGSRALEDTRVSVIEDKTPPGVQALAQMWKTGYSDHIWRLNAPSVPAAEYPVWEPAVTASFADAQLLAQVVTIAKDLAAGYITVTAAERMLQAAGLPDEWVSDITESIDDERDSLEAPRQSGQQPTTEEGAEESEMVSVPTESGEVLRFAKGDVIPTTKGMKKLSDLVNGDELVTLKKAKEVA